MLCDLFQAVMNGIIDIMNDIMNDKKGHNIENEIQQTALLISKITCS